MTVPSDPGPPVVAYQLATCGGAQHLLGVVYALVRNGDLPAIKIGGRGQWRVEDRAWAYIARMYAQTRLRDHSPLRPAVQAMGRRRRRAAVRRGRRPGGGQDRQRAATTRAPDSLTWPVREERTSASAPTGPEHEAGAADLTGRVLKARRSPRRPFQRPFDGAAPGEADHDRRPVARDGAQRDPQPQSHPLTGRRRPVRGRSGRPPTARRTSRRGPGHRRRPRSPASSSHWSETSSSRPSTRPAPTTWTPTRPPTAGRA